MELLVTVLCEAKNEYISNKSVAVKQRFLVCHDARPCLGQRIADSFNYVFTDEEKSQHPEGSLDGKQITIGVSKVDVHNGKLRVSGALPKPADLVKPGKP